ncbi:hypothetical protein Q4603_09485 [Zobellia galactanivorans]|uniref:Uncharacterized protein n=1 Tax=Zobellia galactanivorans (strain DSM 12802 / CCUG 47099 / CIP 106680 / NCIMB 13871 / Dsij) TaxID=63186 RepID=G0KZH0_ZOBGA|nr:hypothetical protein [Zobellia galactanivorans]MBU3024858.1 hypothetical protein [Zobellia galactanivorans]MDO6808843.1 hypothetical protein [Zobellia galactanivorans]CAZ98467.1 hypothetical protein ZOBELLIA_4332 [Zobellia galactanivorans]
MKNIKHIIALFYVTLILLFKVAGLHALTHHIDDSDAQHCEVCHITSAVNFTPLIEAETPVLPQTEFYLFEKKLTNKAPDLVFKDRLLASNRFTRPPPRF